MPILFGRKVQELKNELEDAKDAKKYQAEEAVKARQRAEEAEEKANRKVEILSHKHALELERETSNHQVELKTIRLDEEMKRIAEVSAVSERAIKAEALVEGKDAVIAAQEQTFTRLNEQMQFLCTLVPKIELDKLQFTVNQSANNTSSKE